MKPSSMRPYLEDQVLKLGGTDLAHFELPQPDKSAVTRVPLPLARETTYDVFEQADYTAENEPSLNEEQRSVLNQTFANLDVAIAVASSRIASTLLPNGRMAHSTFKLLIDLVNKTERESTCNIRGGSAETKLLQKAKLIIWDECTMAHRNALHALHKTFEDLRTGQGKFGGVTILLSGDFRQTLPVVPRETKADELNASLIASSLWRHIKVLRLKRNMRVELMGNDEAAKKFTRDLLNLGDGRLPIDSDGLITHPFGQIQMVSTREELKKGLSKLPELPIITAAQHLPSICRC